MLGLFYCFFFYFLKDFDNMLLFLCLQFLFSFCLFYFFLDIIFFLLLIALLSLSFTFFYSIPFYAWYNLFSTSEIIMSFSWVQLTLYVFIPIFCTFLFLNFGFSVSSCLSYPHILIFIYFILFGVLTKFSSGSWFYSGGKHFLQLICMKFFLFILWFGGYNILI